MNFLGVLIVLWAVIGWLVWFAGRKGKDARVRCAACSYDLTACTASETERCPECGVVIAEAGIEHRGVCGGKRRRRVCFAGAMVCALLMGSLVLLKFPPVMQTVRTTSVHQVSATNLVRINQIIVTKKGVDHPGYITNPILYLPPLYAFGEISDDSYVLSHPNVAIEQLDLLRSSAPVDDTIDWLQRVEPRITTWERGQALMALTRPAGRDHFDLRKALYDAAFDNFFPMAQSPWPGAPIISQTSTSPSPQPAIAKWLGLAPSIGADWERTTWLQYSNVVWYVLPSVVVVLLFRRGRKKVRRDAQRVAAEWGSGDTAILRA